MGIQHKEHPLFHIKYADYISKSSIFKIWNVLYTILGDTFYILTVHQFIAPVKIQLTIFYSIV